MVKKKPTTSKQTSEYVPPNPQMKAAAKLSKQPKPRIQYTESINVRFVSNFVIIVLLAIVPMVLRTYIYEREAHIERKKLHVNLLEKATRPLSYKLTEVFTDENVNKTRIIITGVTGFIGMQVALYFGSLRNKSNYHILGLDNFLSLSHNPFFRMYDKKMFDFYEYDVSRPFYLNGTLPRVDYIYHFASLPDPETFTPWPNIIVQVNAIGTAQVLELAKRTGAKVLVASSSEIYGHVKEHPQNETYIGNSLLYNERSCYGESKRLAEALTYAYQNQHNVSTYLPRIFNTYGPRSTSRVTYRFIRQAYSNQTITVFAKGNQTRSFLYIDDLVDGLVALMNSDVHTPINFGSPYEVTILDYAKFIKSNVPYSISKIKIIPNPRHEPKLRKPDISKAKKLLNWEPTVPLQEGIQNTVNDVILFWHHDTIDNEQRKNVYKIKYLDIYDIEEYLKAVDY